MRLTVYTGLDSKTWRFNASCDLMHLFEQLAQQWARDSGCGLQHSKWESWGMKCARVSAPNQVKTAKVAIRKCWYECTDDDVA